MAMREISSGIIVFRQAFGQRLYLLLHYHYRGDYWDFPRGNIREDETPKEAAVRETEEETGLTVDQLKIIEGFEEHVRWFYRIEKQMVQKKVTYFLAETNVEDVKVSEEHIGAKWLSFENALNLLQYKNSKKMLQKAEDFLRKLNGQELPQKS
jgi:bis(5'-nucleosidyl)-tetraphosphatase